jgi:hypothetical protein
MQFDWDFPYTIRGQVHMDPGEEKLHEDSIRDAWTWVFNNLAFQLFGCALSELKQFFCLVPLPAVPGLAAAAAAQAVGMEC